jgi:phage terminase Nu1 subunit (DNA packaging protein)
MESLGEALTVKEVAALIGCSPWTVRQKHIPRGLPCFRSGPCGRLTFYRNQVVAWILEKQNEQKGGTRK